VIRLALYAIGDLHLSLGTDKPMDVFGGDWSNYTEKIEKGFSRLDSGDVCVICGDTSWGMTIEESLADFKFLDSLPGRKIILKGNHDYWWTTVSKMRAFFDRNDINSIDILNNNCFFYKDSAICGTRGWLLDSETEDLFNDKIMARETGRLRASLDAAGDAAEKLCFFHYPPRFRDMVCEDIIAVMDRYRVRKCWYGHLHGAGQRHAIRGNIGGIEYEMVSADFIDFIPGKIM